ncbi:MAG: hypothetical protein AAGI23_15965 [Bacteroidota bacterium]
MKSLFGFLLGASLFYFYYNQLHDMQQESNRPQTYEERNYFQYRLEQQEESSYAQLQDERERCLKDKALAIERVRKETILKERQQATADKEKALTEQRTRFEQRCEGEKDAIRAEVDRANDLLEQTRAQVDILLDEKHHFQFQQRMMVAIQARLVKHIEQTKKKSIFQKSQIVDHLDQSPLTVVFLIGLLAFSLAGIVARLGWSKNKRRLV